MKIYYVANARMPSEKAHGIQLAKMCEAFLLRGADLELVLPRRGEGRSLKDFYGLQVEIPVRRLPVLNFGFILSSFSFMISSYFYLRRKKDAIIYTIDMDNFSFVFLRFLGLPYFSEIHGAKKKAFFWEVFLKKISGSIVINNNIKKSLMGTFGLASKKIMVKPNGIDLEMFSGTITKEEARKKLDLPPDKKIAIYVGREVSWKGMGILLEAQKFLTDETIYIISDRPYQEIPYWLRAADLCIVIGTKKNEYSYLHTSPMKLFEYMASGRPILAADTPANREIVSENEAYFYEPDNPKDLADKISKIMTNLLDSKLKVDNARAKVENYTWSKRAKEILEFIRNGQHSVSDISSLGVGHVGF
ncbi:MAG: group 1 glycosyl transferase [Candidatus Peregrinibacteria bacterium GW2011_GWC2_39_14]|nr:MAG: group 1 glycosyl transferase [Candidatus Peregrinibacteria bacterium GW2011_GWC2_39_14]